MFKGVMSLRTFNKVKGASVFCGETNRKLGNITDLMYDLTANLITGYWLDNGQWWTKKHALALSLVNGETKKGFYVNTTDSLLPVTEKNKRFFHGNDRLMGQVIKKEDGDMVGIIEDVYFLPSTGKIIGYQVTEGLFEDFKGIKVIRTNHSTVHNEKDCLSIIVQ